MRQRIRHPFALAAVLCVAAAAVSLYVPIPHRRLSPAPILSLRLTDRQGLLLREALSDEAGRCRWAALDEISPHLIRATIAAEDKRFPEHGGIDVTALARAAAQNLRRGRVVSGASTISQQVIRNIYRHPRTLPGKIAEAWLAVRLEHTLSKGDILLQYLNRIPYGRQAIGIEAAARFYFDKPASLLSPAESAYLAALPRAPGRYHSTRDDGPVRLRQREILHRMQRLGFLAREVLARALAEPLGLSGLSRDFKAPHFVEYALSRIPAEERPGLAEIRTTLDLNLQGKVESLLDVHLRILGRNGPTNGAVIVLENRTGAVRAMVGSRDFFDEAGSGQVNGALALRQPGSTLKPLTYALALENGFSAATLIDDLPAAFITEAGSFSPDNYDERSHGPVRLRSALASSYNVPAVSVLEVLGPERLHRRLLDMGFGSLQHSAGYYGLGLTLGNGEVTLLELARAYAALARGGLYREETFIESVRRKDGREGPVPGPAPGSLRVFTPQATFIITDILSDRDARVPAFGYVGPLNLPFPTAVKTGTSKDFRDNWTLGYTTRHTVAVWVGHFDGSPMFQISGVTGAGPLFRDIMLLLESRLPPERFPEPAGLVRMPICPVSGERPSPDCPATIVEVFVSGTEPRDECGLSHRPDAGPRGAGPSDRSVAPIEITFPANGDVFRIDTVLRPEYQALRLRVAVAAGSVPKTVEWRVNGVLVAAVPPPYTLTWNLKPGSYTITAQAVLEATKAESPPVTITVLS